MKTFGWIFIVIGALSFLGAFLKGNSVMGPVFWLGLGIYLVHRSAQKKEEQKDMEEWANNNRE